MSYGQNFTLEVSLLSVFFRSRKILDRLKKVKPTTKQKMLQTRVKRISEQLSRTRFFTGFENSALFPCHIVAEKRAVISNYVKNRVLKSCSNIVFTLIVLEKIFTKVKNWFVIKRNQNFGRNATKLFFSFLVNFSDFSPTFG